MYFINNMQVGNVHNSLIFGTTYKKSNNPDYDLSKNWESSTCFFKYDLQWNKFFDHVIEHYKDTPKVNVYSLACSDGSEAFSIAMILMTKLGDKADKFFPITAVDFDEDVLKNAKKGYIDLSAKDELNINKYTNNQLNRFLERTNYTHISEKIGCSDERELLTRYRIKPELREKVIFKQADIRDYIDTMPNKDNLIFCRNCWPYLYKEIHEFSQKLSEKVDKNSFLVIGSYDAIICPLTTTKNYCGFSMNRDFKNVFDKSGNDYFDSMRALFSQNFKDE